MIYQIEARYLGKTTKKYDGIESPNSTQAIDRVIQENYADDMLEYNNQLLVLGYTFIARQMGMFLS